MVSKEDEDAPANIVGSRSTFISVLGPTNPLKNTRPRDEPPQEIVNVTRLIRCQCYRFAAIVVLVRCKLTPLSLNLCVSERLSSRTEYAGGIFDSSLLTPILSSQIWASCGVSPHRQHPFAVPCSGLDGDHDNRWLKPVVR